jgi:tetratricopeptide (TPR) repeat protein
MIVNNWIMRLLGCWLLLHIVGVVYAQQQAYLDSLHQVADFPGKDSSRLRAMSRLAIAYGDSAPYKAIAYAQQALALTQEMKSDFLSAVVNNQLGAVNMNVGRLEEAQKNFIDADSLFRLEGREDRLGDVLLNLGSVMGQQGYFAKARVYIRQARALYEKQEDLPRVSLALSHLGLSYVYQDSLKIGISYLKQSFAQAKKLNIDALQLTPITNLGFAYFGLKELDSALLWIEKGKILSQNLSDNSNYLVNLNNEASVYEEQQRYNKNVSFG